MCTSGASLRLFIRMRRTCLRTMLIWRSRSCGCDRVSYVEIRSTSWTELLVSLDAWSKVGMGTAGCWGPWLLCGVIPNT